MTLPKRRDVIGAKDMIVDDAINPRLGLWGSAAIAGRSIPVVNYTNGSGVAGKEDQFRPPFGQYTRIVPSVRCHVA